MASQLWAEEESPKQLPRLKVSLQVITPASLHLLRAHTALASIFHRRHPRGQARIPRHLALRLLLGEPCPLVPLIRPRRQDHAQHPSQDGTNRLRCLHRHLVHHLHTPARKVRVGPSQRLASLSPHLPRDALPRAVSLRWALCHQRLQIGPTIISPAGNKPRQQTSLRIKSHHLSITKA